MSKIQQEVSDQLVEIFRPFAESIVRSRLKKEKRIFWLQLLVIKVFIAYAWLCDKEFRDFWKLTHADRKSQKLDDREMDDQEVVDTVRELVRIWTVNLIYSGHETGEKLPVSALDGAMVPPPVRIGTGEERMPSVYEQVSCATLLTADDTRAILRAVRESLSDGQILPTVLTEYLQCAGITVVD